MIQIPIDLAENELITHALKHAFTKKNIGVIWDPEIGSLLLTCCMIFFLHTLPHTAERVVRQNPATIVSDVPFLFTRTERTHEQPLSVTERIAYR